MVLTRTPRFLLQILVEVGNQGFDLVPGELQLHPATAGVGEVHADTILFFFDLPPFPPGEIDFIAQPVGA